MGLAGGDRAVARRGRFPNALAHQGFVPNASGQLVNVGVHPLARPYLEFFYSEIPTGQDFGDGTAEIADVLQHGDAERRVERAVGERQVAGIGRSIAW